MDLEGCWMSRFHFLEVGSWILKVAGCSVVCVIFFGGGIMDFQGVKVSILEFVPYILYISITYVIFIMGIMYIKNMLFHMVPFSALAFKVPSGFLQLLPKSAPKNGKTPNQANCPHEICVPLPCFHSLYSC